MNEFTHCGPVLIAEDDSCMSALVADVLEDAGYATVVACTGPAAVAVAREERPSAAVLDVNLPGLSGYEVCRELRREHGSWLPILFVSGERTEPYDRVAGLMLGGDDYLAKPFAPGELLARLRSLLRRAEPAAAARAELTPRELEVLTLLAEGLDQTQIAQRLAIRSKTVATHLERVLAKLGVRSRAQAVAVAYRDALVTV
jgi:DNA-binding response OmpR family regulator